MQYQLHGSPVADKPSRAQMQRDRETRNQRRAQERQDRKQRECKHRFSFEHFEVPSASPAELHFRHSHWQVKRAKVFTALQSAGATVTALNQFCNCGAAVTVYYSATENRHLLKGSYCHSRHCEPCMRAKASAIARNLRSAIEDNPDLQHRFITLTLQHSDTPLADQIKHLYKSFTKLRNMKCWLTTQRGGSCSLEVKWNADTRRWHPHLHIIATGTYLDKHTLSEAWRTATNGSYIVDIRILKDAKEAAYYVGKYVAKGTNGEVWSDPNAAQEWIIATKGVRTCLTWGNWRGKKLTEKRPWPVDAKPVATFNALLAAALRAELWAVNALADITPMCDPEEVRSRYIMDTGDG